MAYAQEQNSASYPSIALTLTRSVLGIGRRICSYSAAGLSKRRSPIDSINKFTTREDHREQPPHELQYHWRSTGGITYGSFLNFRGLQHSPLNEQGVVFLFGMVCHELGFVVEAIRPDYPDCEAKRLVDKKQDKWERVRIEFEFKSSSFKAHGHKPDLCDVIVCWEHDWPECPLEVIELKSAIKSLAANNR